MWPPFFFFSLTPTGSLLQNKQTGPSMKPLNILASKYLSGPLSTEKKENNCGSGPPACLMTSLILSPHICGLFNDINNCRGGVHFTFLEEFSMWLTWVYRRWIWPFAPAAETRTPAGAAASSGRRTDTQSPRAPGVSQRVGTAPSPGKRSDEISHIAEIHCSNVF